jgi:alpha-tubulin suppressor-like RCC1 family protein
VAATHFPIQNGTTLNAVFSNGLGVVNPGNLRIISGAPLPIKPAMMTRYTLIVTNAAGSKCIANATAYPAIPVAAGLNHCIARKSDGTVWTWGHNMRGQLGDGTNQDRNTPGIVNNFSDVVAVTSGEDQSFSIKNEGSVWAWGFNECGQLGDGTSNNQKLPVKVINLPPRVVALAATFLDTRAIIDKTIWIWGHSATIFPTPTNQENVVAISTYPTIALYDDGTVNVPNGEDLRNLSAVAATYNSYFALKNDGTIWEWDINNKPAQKPGFTDIVAIAGGFYHKLALKSDGTVWGWGDNSCGQLGDGTTTPRQDPVKANGLDNIVAIAASIYGYFSIAIKNDGTVWGWGNNLYGSLGDGTNTDHYIPVQIPNFKLW